MTGDEGQDNSETLAERKMRFLFSLRSRGVTDKRVLEAMERVDRGAFVRGHFADRAYDDMPLPIACGQTISQPSVVGLMTQALEVGPRDIVLEVGTGSGYQAAVLSQLARRVYTVDRHRRLVREAQGVFTALGLHNIVARTGDGCLGTRPAGTARDAPGLPLPRGRDGGAGQAPFGEQAPFDRIIVTAAAEDPPPTLLDQLRIGGIMVLPVGQSDAVQQLVRVRRLEHGFDYEDLRPVRFVPLVEGVAPD
ncbi:protein-L-isoaspartate O-methyltransferase [Gemmobacter sp.]|uniref:protein-L-isoaspartate O-methyltransferase family protein n=1 Tax=Gemmobacter sp. TaxID=1898957 RepID=UPI002AFF0FA0|nr:protein-L-isoaspartate O-methyltransferase [Gemmobacter sp.]